MSLVSSRTVRGVPVPVRVRRPGERRSLSRSATRALDVLELFGSARRPLRAIEIAQTLAMHPSTANQLLKTMVDSGHLAFDARAKTYLPSHRLAAFSAWIAETHGTGEPLRELVRSLQSRTGLVVTLSTPNDLDMQLVDLAVPEGWSGERGLRVSLFGSAIGSAYLATLEQRDFFRLAGRARIAEAELPGLLADAAAIRGAGHASGAIAASGFWSIARPLPDHSLSVPTVLGLSGPEDRVRPHIAELVADMRAAIAHWREGV